MTTAASFADADRAAPAPSERELAFMRRALATAEEAAGRGEVPVGAVVVLGDQIVSVAHNERETGNDPTAHAEIVAIREACRKLGHFELTGCDLYTSCEPCPMCLGAIYWARPARVFYANTAADAASIGFDDAFIYSELKRPLVDRKIPMIPHLREKAMVAFIEWKAKIDKAPY